MKNWNPDWLPVLEKIAHKVLSRSYTGHGLEAYDLINHAWLDSLRRLDGDADIRFVATVAYRSMKQMVSGGKSAKSKNLSTIRRQSYSLDTLKEEAFYQPYYETETPVCELVDEVLKFLKNYSKQRQEILLLKLSGMTQREIAMKYGVCESNISYMLRKIKKTEGVTL
jgi:RNA polymerase sigma factor (sigma-70 family)